MFVGHLLFALITALVLGAILTLVLKAQNPWNRYWALFMLLTFSAWVGGLWLAPFGPAVGGIFILPFFFLAILFGLLIAATGPHPATHTNQAGEPAYTQEEMRGVVGTREALSIYFWVLVIVLLIAIGVRYLYMM